MRFDIRNVLLSCHLTSLSLAVAISSLYFSGTVFGQTLGQITGEVRDPSGSVVVGAAVQATNSATGAERRVVSNGAGVYAFPSLQPGVYDVSVSMQGFQSMTRTGLELQVQQTSRVDFTLQVGQSSQSVSVSAEAPLLTTEDATVGSVIENKRIVDLPLNGRNFLQLVSLTPNVSVGFGSNGSTQSIVGGDRAQQNISVSGARSEFNHFTLDGVENTDPDYNTYVFLPSIDALEEFKVQTGVYPAEFGRGIGQVNVSTKAGTNAFHGTAYEFLRNDMVDARSYAFVRAVPQNPFKWNQYGFTLGGPVWIPKLFNGRNRLFFMSNYEGFRLRQTANNSYSVPTATMASGNFSGRPVIYDPGTRAQQGNAITAQPFPANIIPATRLNSRALILREFIPAPNVATASLSNDLLQGDRTPVDKDQFTQRIDFVESAKSSWYGRYSWGSEGQSQHSLGGAGTIFAAEPRQEMISNSRVFSPTIVNEFRFSHTGFGNNATVLLANVRNVPGELNIPGISPPPNAWGIPNFGINTFSTFGDALTGPYTINDHIFQVVDNLSWTRGKHSLRFGAELRRDRFNTSGNATQRGSFSFSGTATENPIGPLGYSAGTGTSLADFLLGYVSSGTVAVGVGFAQFRNTSQSYYVDDTWRIHRTLTVSMGLRYEFVPPYYDKSQHLMNVSLPLTPYPGLINPSNPALHPTMVRLGQGDFYQDIPFRFNSAINVARDGRLGRSGVEADKNNFAPRIGIAWSPTDRWTVRTGIGVFFAQDIAGFFLDAARNLTGAQVVTSSTTFPNVLLDNPFQILGNSLPIVSTPKILGIQVNRPTPYSIQYLFNVQRQLTQNTALEIGYLGSESHKLESWVTFNESVPSTIGTPASRAPFPEISPLAWIMSGQGNSNYQSLTAKLQHRFSRGLSFMASYGWSKSVDLSSGARNHAGEQQFPQSGYCLQCERGLSNFNVAHRFVTSGLYELPFGKGRAFLDRGGVTNVLLGGWQINSILSLQTGTPATVIAGYDASNRGYNAPADRPNSTGVDAALPADQRTANAFFNKAAFVRVPAGTLGNVGRNTLIGPGIINLDSSIFKSFRVREQQQLQFRFEFFNAANHPNFGLPDTSLTSAGFGTIRTTNTSMRKVQFGLKYIF